MTVLIPVRVEGVVVLPREQAPSMLLRETAGQGRQLAVVIGVPEAENLVNALQQRKHGRPGTIELLDEVINALGSSLQGVSITGLRDGIFIAALRLADGVTVSARPSDAIALAVRSGAYIEVAEEVLEEASVSITIFDETTGESPVPGADEGEIAQFRAELDDITPDDFGTAS